MVAPVMVVIYATVLFGLVVSIALLLVSAVLLGVMGGVTSLADVSVRSAAWTLDRDIPGQPIRWAGVLLLVVGFHFDLLAS